MIDALRSGLTALAIGTTIALLTYTIARSLGARLPQEWKIGEISLSPIRWLAFTAIVLVIARIGTSIYDYVDLKWAQSQIPPRDHSRFSVVVTDFEGQGGTTAADIIAQELQASFGYAIQVRRVPDHIPESKYGDVIAHLFNSMTAGGWCAKRYDADIVVWGDFDPTSNTVRLGHTIKTDECFPSRCGLGVFGEVPHAYSLTDIGNRSSPLERALGSIAVSKATLVVNEIALHPTGEKCFENASNLAAYERKTNRLVEAGIDDLSVDDRVRLLFADGIYHYYHADIANSSVALDAALARMNEARQLNDPLARELSQPYALILLRKEWATQNPEERLQLAQTIESLPESKTDQSLAFRLRELKISAWEAAYSSKANQALYEKVDGEIAAALALTSDKSVQLELEIRRASINLDRLRFGYREAYHNSAVALVDASRIMYLLDPSQQTTVPLQELYRFHAARLQFSELQSDPRLGAEASEALFRDSRASKENWGDADYVEMRRSLASRLFVYFEQTDDITYLEGAMSVTLGIARHSKSNLTKAASYFSLAQYAEKAMPYVANDVARAEAIQFYREAAKYYGLLKNIQETQKSQHDADRVASVAVNYERRTLHPHCIHVTVGPDAPAVYCVRSSMH